MQKIILSLLMTFVIFATGGPAMAMGSNSAVYTPKPRNPGKYVPWECSFESERVPPLSPAADALFQKARTLQRTLIYPTEGEKMHIFSLYKQAAEQGHWKAMSNLANCYLNGNGTERNVAAADALYEQMMALGIPLGFYGKSLLVRKGWVAKKTKDEANRLRQKAADLGSPLAQHVLGDIGIREWQDKQAMGYLICALRQGYAPAAETIGFYLYMTENYPMAMEYYWRGLELGEQGCALRLEQIFGIREGVTDPLYTLGYKRDPALEVVFNEYYYKLDADPTLRFPNLLKDHPIPENTLLTREQSRAMPSALKEVFGGQWPDEIFLELAPGYIPPEY